MGIFDDITDFGADIFDSAEETIGDLLEEVGYEKEDIYKLAATGLAAYEISEATGLAVDVIEQILDE